MQEKEINDALNQDAAEQEEVSEAVNQEETADSTEELSDVARLEAELAEAKDKYLRLYSEFDNYRRRTAKERLELIKTASEDVITKLIPVLDDFERGLVAAEKAEDVSQVIAGNQLIFQKFTKILENQGLKSMEDAKGKDFDAELQEAITQIPAPDESLKGKVVDVVEKGYYLGDKVVRFAKVVIGA